MARRDTTRTAIKTASVSIALLKLASDRFFDMPHCTELMIMKFGGLQEDQVYENELLLVVSQAYEEEQEHQELVASQAYSDEEESLRDKCAKMQSEDLLLIAG